MTGLFVKHEGATVLLVHARSVYDGVSGEENGDYDNSLYGVMIR